jgi:hypothetical protein
VRGFARCVGADRPCALAKRRVFRALSAPITTLGGLSVDGMHLATDHEIRYAMSGNLCRCGTYLRIPQAIHKAALTANKGAERHHPELGGHEVA